MHYVSVGALVSGFGCEGSCGEFENGKIWQLGMLVRQGKSGQGGLGMKLSTGVGY